MSESTMTVDEDGVQRWLKNSELHRVDGPAIIFPDGTKRWHQNGRLHRIGGPAVEYADGTKQWLRNGHLHRLDGPAIEWSEEKFTWYIKHVWYINGYYLGSDLEGFWNLWDRLDDEERQNINLHMWRVRLTNV